jgi:hypothetical protein
MSLKPRDQRRALKPSAKPVALPAPTYTVERGAAMFNTPRPQPIATVDFGKRGQVLTVFACTYISGPGGARQRQRRESQRRRELPPDYVGRRAEAAHRSIVNREMQGEV